MGRSICAPAPGRVLLGVFAALVTLAALKLHAGGSGLNTVVVANQASSNSCELANYYCQQRQVPPQNVLYVNWAGGNTLWSSNDLQTNLITPLLNMLIARGLTNQIDFVVLSMDIPFQTSDGSTLDGTTSVLFYGLRLGSGDPLGTTNSYAASERIFSQVAPLVGSPGYSFLTTMITGVSLAPAEQLVNQGVSSDGTFPKQPVILAKSSDVSRNVRYIYFDNAIFNVNILGISSIFRTNTDSVWWYTPCMGFETGLPNFSVSQGTFVPGALADSLTSFGGDIFGNSGQTTELAFIDGGAAGSYGTVSEPADDPLKFPNSQVYFYQARGFNLAESYYQSINEPYLGLTVGDPLAAPFARPGFGQWGTNLVNTVLNGTANLSVNIYAHDAGHPIQQVDLFVDGVYYTTLTNVPPAAGNLLTATVNGYPVTYTVPLNATLSTVASGLAASINAVSTNTQVTGTPFGDRIQLECTAMNPATAAFYVAVNTPASTPTPSYSAKYLPDTFPPEMMAGSRNRSGAYTMTVDIPTALPNVIQASTNLLSWQPIFTNNTPGVVNFIDWGSTNFPIRFYRISSPVPGPPQLSAPGISAGTFQMQISGTTGKAWAVQFSTDLVNWVSIFTNQAGGTMDFADTNFANSPARFYRAYLAPTPAPALNVLNVTTNQTLLRVSSASLPFTVGVSTNAGQWTPLATNFAIGQIQSTASSSQGTGVVVSTFLSAAQPLFMTSQAIGMAGYTVYSNSFTTTSWMQFSFTKTNGQVVTVAITNQPGGNSAALASQMYNAINANPALQGNDGVQAEDFIVNSTWPTFNIYSRSPGLAAAQIQVQPQYSPNIIMFKPLGGSLQGPLTQNLSNLEPRNHLYVSAGASRLALTFPLATTNLADGYHVLTAVAYEGTDVRTETQTSMPMQIQNSSLSATLTVLDVTNTVPTDGSFQIQVTANTNNVSLITLYSTGGAFAAATNESTAMFQVAGTNLWAGQHPFYAIVQTSSGSQYRTQTQVVTITP